MPNFNLFEIAAGLCLAPVILIFISRTLYKHVSLYSFKAKVLKALTKFKYQYGFVNTRIKNEKTKSKKTIFKKRLSIWDSKLK